MIDTKKLRQAFPVYQNNKKITYLDSAASTFKHVDVIDIINHYNTHLGVNVHRGGYDLAYQATKLYEDAREIVADFIHAQTDEIIFTRGTTSSLNAVARMYEEILTADDEIITSELEHHSSILPWMEVARKTKAKLIYVPLTEEGKITVSSFSSVLSKQTKIVALTHISNALGYETPIKEIAKLAKEVHAAVVLDAAQSAPHIQIDVKDLDIDFLAFSGHKMFGPTSVGVLYGKKELLEKLSPFEFGGEMVDFVYKDHAVYKESPLKFEAGTPVITGAIGLSKAVSFMKSIGYDKINEHTHALHQYTLEKMKKIEGITIYNPNAEHPIIAFNINDVHPHDATTILDQDFVCVRAGHHCAQLVTKFLNVTATLRASFHIYNDFDDCNNFLESIIKARDFFRQF
jgi:cysteine desulfurase / selenocysteine lyase